MSRQINIRRIVARSKDEKVDALFRETLKDGSTLVTLVDGKTGKPLNNDVVSLQQIDKINPGYFRMAK